MSIWTSIFHGAAERNTADRVIVIGTAAAVRQARRTLRQAERATRPAGCVLLRPMHRSGAVGLPVLGTVEQLAMILSAHRISRAMVSLPAAMGEAARRIEAVCREQGVEVRHLPTLADQLAGRAGRIAAVDPATLVNRPPHPLDHELIRQALSGKRVMITGAGGSIGSHLAMLVAGYAPAQLLLMERAENNLFEIDRRLKSEYPDVPRSALLHDVADERGTLELCERYCPQVIFHAAAHKHVPMMEDHPRAALENNFFGTKAVADAAVAIDAERFVLISTDKAVHPSSVMGATKRLAEIYVQHRDSRSATRFSLVRFGNVLGSACSVAPIWADQLSRGGPLTVTDPRMTRYFMTIPEAASLVLQAAAMQGQSGRVFVLDMGQPIRIMDLAHRFAEAHGLMPGKDIEIVTTGIRPGEKIHEQLAYDNEAMEPTRHPSVRTVHSDAPTPSQMEQMLHRFGMLRAGGDGPAIRRALALTIPETQLGDPPGPTVLASMAHPVNRSA